VVSKDLLDAYQARQRELLTRADAAVARGLPTALSEAAAQAAAYWPILAPRYALDRGGAAAARLGDGFAALAAAGRAGDLGAYRTARSTIRVALAGFTAAPLTAEESARRAQQLLRFLALVPVEYERGVEGTRVTLAFEIQEAVAFRSGAAAALDDLQSQLARRDAHRAATVAAGLGELGAIVGEASRRRDGVAPPPTCSA
jgi:high-affinity iron transporter